MMEVVDSFEKVVDAVLDSEQRTVVDDEDEMLEGTKKGRVESDITSPCTSSTIRSG